MDVKKLIKRLLLSQKDPDLIKGLSEQEIAFLVSHLVAKMESHNKFTQEIRDIITNGKMKSEEEYRKSISEFQKRIENIDVEKINMNKQEIERLVKEANSINSRMTEAERMMLEKAESLRDGRDADEKMIAKSVSELLRSELPKSIKGELIGVIDTLAERINENEKEIEELEMRLKTVETKPGSGGGGVTNARIAQAFKYILKTEAPSGDIDGANTSYTVTQPIFAVLAFSLNGEVIAELPNYTVNGNTITFSSALPAAYSGKDFEVKYV